MAKISEVVLHKTDTKNVFVEVKCEIETSGNLKLSSYTIGQITQEYVCHDDYELKSLLAKNTKTLFCYYYFKIDFRVKAN